MDKTINNLRPGQSVILTKANGITVSVERSGNGKVIRFVRSTKIGFEIFKICVA